MALAMRLNASFSLPWLPQHQYFVPSGLCHWYYDVAQDGIDLREVINMTRLGSVLPVDFNNDERCLANNSGSRVAIQIHRHGAHWIRPDYFAPSGTIAQNTTPQSLHLPKLDSMGGFDSAIQAIHTLRRRYRGDLPVTILVRMYGKFPLVGALGRHGVRVFDWRVPAAYKLVPSPRWLRPPMTENLLKLFYARHSRLFIAERGSCWPDLVTMIRSEYKQPSMTMRAGKNASLLLDTVPRCVRVRGTCTDPTAPFPYREGAC
jgi:hypothetical protein